MQVLEGISRGRAGIFFKKSKSKRMNGTLIDTHPPGHMVLPSVEPSVCRSNRESQWRTDTQLVIITFDW